MADTTRSGRATGTPLCRSTTSSHGQCPMPRLKNEASSVDFQTCSRQEMRRRSRPLAQRPQRFDPCWTSAMTALTKRKFCRTAIASIQRATGDSSRRQIGTRSPDQRAYVESRGPSASEKFRRSVDEIDFSDPVRAVEPRGKRQWPVACDLDAIDRISVRAAVHAVSPVHTIKGKWSRLDSPPPIRMRPSRSIHACDFRRPPMGKATPITTVSGGSTGGSRSSAASARARHDVPRTRQRPVASIAQMTPRGDTQHQQTGESLPVPGVRWESASTRQPPARTAEREYRIGAGSRLP